MMTSYFLGVWHSITTKKEFKKGVKYACNQCDHQFTQQSSLKTHIQSVHEGIKYACKRCNYQAILKGNLTFAIKA